MDLSMKKSLPLAGILCAARISSALAATKGVFSTATDSAYQTPIPPNDLFPINPEHVFVTTVVLSIIAVVFLILAVRDGRKFRSTVPVALVLGGAANVIPESVDNYLGGVYWAQSHVPSDIMFVLMGREFDWYITVIWWVYAAGVRYLFYASLMRRSSTKKLWLCMALAGLADFVLEEVLLSYGGIYTYYGNQPLVLFRHFLLLLRHAGHLRHQRDLLPRCHPAPWHRHMHRRRHPYGGCHEDRPGPESFFLPVHSIKQYCPFFPYRREPPFFPQLSKG